MKKIFNAIILFHLSSILWGQIDANNLIGLPVATNAEMIAITDANEGSLLFNDDLKKVYQWNGTEWKELLERPPTVHNKTANFTATIFENNDLINFDTTADVILTLPVLLPVGYNISVYQIGTGRVTIQGDGTTEVRNRLDKFQTSGEGAGVGVIQTATNIFHLTGDLRRE